jgi:hypothetical protein
MHTRIAPTCSIAMSKEPIPAADTRHTIIHIDGDTHEPRSQILDTRMLARLVRGTASDRDGDNRDL